MLPSKGIALLGATAVIDNGQKLSKAAFGFLG
jgi:hypothetical protein